MKDDLRHVLTDDEGQPLPDHVPVYLDAGELRGLLARIEKLAEGFNLADKLVCAAIESGFYVGEGLLAQLAEARALTSTREGLTGGEEG